MLLELSHGRSVRRQIHRKTETPYSVAGITFVNALLMAVKRHQPSIIVVSRVTIPSSDSDCSRRSAVDVSFSWAF